MIYNSEEKAIFKVQSTTEEGRAAKEAINFNELNTRIIKNDPRIASIEKLQSFTVDSQDFSRSLQVRKNLPAVAKEKVKYFLHDNLDVFVWKYEDMVGIDPRVSFQN